MQELITDTVKSIEDFSHYRQPWNQLWDQSNAYEPLSRCEGLQLWVKQFADRANFSAILVWNGDQLVGGLPLIRSQKRGIKLLKLPNNEWVNAGELMVRSDYCVDAVVTEIVKSLGAMAESIICFNGIRFQSEAWATFSKQIQNNGGQVGILRTEEVGVIEIANDWDSYFKNLSGNHRSTVRRAEKKARKSGELSLLTFRDLSTEDCQKWMNTAFEIENRSWKRENATSILASDGMAEFYLAEAEIARQAGLLELWFLMLDDQAIAFEYCHRAKGICLSYKIGYDEAFKTLAPGKVLRKLQLESLHTNIPNSVLDTKGILCSTKAKWVTKTYQTGRLLAAVNGHIPKMLIGAYLQARPIIQQFRGIGSGDSTFHLGGATPIEQ